MSIETIERKEDYDASDYSYQSAIDETVNTLKSRYDVLRVERVRAAYDGNFNEWWVTVDVIVPTGEKDE